jgi:hypothetical protein
LGRQHGNTTTQPAKRCACQLSLVRWRCSVAFDARKVSTQLARSASSNILCSNYTPEVLLCGGSKNDDTVPPSQLSSQTSASKQCARMVLTPEGIAAGWQVESMPGNRMMIDAIVMPDGNVLLINGASTGVSAFSIFHIQISCLDMSRWLVTAMFLIKSANRMLTTLVTPHFS